MPPRNALLEIVQFGRGYPRPQLVRDAWVSLNGDWEFALDRAGSWRGPGDVTWASTIRVPFAPESPASGIGDTSFFRSCWYRRTVPIEPAPDGSRVMLHFGGVDYEATVWVNGQLLGSHRGGYTPFSFDVTPSTVDATSLEIVVRADDDPQDLAKPRGKQDWQLDPHSIWYPRTSGIWQTVWLERVPPTYIGRVAFTPDLARWEIGVQVWLQGDRRSDLRLGVRLRTESAVLAADTYQVVSGEVHRGIALSDPGIDDSRNELLWSPNAPHLIDVELELWG